MVKQTSDEKHTRLLNTVYLFFIPNIPSLPLYSKTAKDLKQKHHVCVAVVLR